MEDQSNFIEKVCKDCGGIQVYRRIYVGEKAFEIIKEKCECLKDEEEGKKVDWEKVRKEEEEAKKTIRIQSLKRISMIDGKFKNIVFKNWNGAESSKKVIDTCYKYYENFEKNFNENIGMFLTGGVGIGKTYAVSCLANELINQEKRVICASINRLLKRFKENYSNNKSEDEVLELLAKVDLLIIDDLGIEQLTEWFNNIFYEIIDARYRENKPLIITSNLSIEQMGKRYHERINSRIFEMCVPVNCGNGDIREIEAEKKLKKLALELQEQN